VLFALRDVSVLSIRDGVAHSYFHDVSARRDLYFLRLLGELLRLTRLHSVDENYRTHRRSYHNELSRIGRVGPAMKQAAARYAKQQDNKECFQWNTLAWRK